MNRQKARKVVFDVINASINNPACGTDMLAWNIVDALGFTDDGQNAKPQPLTGFEIIGEMSRQQLMDECIAFQINLWQRIPIEALRKMVVTARTNAYLDRLTKEAGLSDNGPEGFTSIFS